MTPPIPARLHPGDLSEATKDSPLCSCDVTVEGRSGQAYNEQAFGYFLEIERKRSERSNRPFLLLLVDLKKEPGEPEKNLGLNPALATRLFSGLWTCLRETDFVGWYREGRVAGAVLTQPADMSRTDVSGDVGPRIRELLCKGLPPDAARRLQVRVYQLPPGAPGGV
ncbi:MAG: hypothetical protein WBD07_18740 [Vicinamibacterales bacterium]